MVGKGKVEQLRAVSLKTGEARLFLQHLADRDHVELSV